MVVMQCITMLSVTSINTLALSCCLRILRSNILHCSYLKYLENTCSFFPSSQTLLQSHLMAWQCAKNREHICQHSTIAIKKILGINFFPFRHPPLWSTPQLLFERKLGGHDTFPILYSLLQIFFWLVNTSWVLSMIKITSYMTFISGSTQIRWSKLNGYSTFCKSCLP